MFRFAVWKNDVKDARQRFKCDRKDRGCQHCHFHRLVGWRLGDGGQGGGGGYG